MAAGDIRYNARCRHGTSDHATLEEARSMARAWIKLDTSPVYIELWTSDGKVYQPEYLETLTAQDARGTEP